MQRTEKEIHTYLEKIKRDEPNKSDEGDVMRNGIMNAALGRTK